MKNYRFSVRWFLVDNCFWYERYENVNGTIVFTLSSRFEARAFWPWKVNSKIWPQVRSDQGQIITQVGQNPCLPKRLDEPSRLAPFARPYLNSVASYWRKTDCGLMWPQMTFSWTPIISCIRIITYGVSGLDPERIGPFRLVYAKWEAFSYFPIGL